MEFVSAIAETIKTQKGIINGKFYAILCDYRAFDDEEFCVKGIVKQICDNGFIIQLSKLSSSNKIWKNKMADMIYKMTNQYGYQKDIVSEVFHKLAIGFGIIDNSFDWKKEFLSENNNTNNQSNPQGEQRNQQSPKLPLAGASQSPKSTSFAWLKCPYCGTSYHKAYSSFCHICGEQRQ